MKCKKIISLFLSALTVGSGCWLTVPAQAATKEPLLIGDADRDGDIAIGDVTAIQRVLAELDTFDGQTAKMAKTDFSRDALTISDATLIQQHIAEVDSPAAREVGHAAFIWRGSKYYEAISEYQRYIEQQMSTYKINGVGYVTRNGRVLAQHVTGTANVAAAQPMTFDTRFCIGSVSKQICAAAVLLLQEQGKLSTDDTLDKYFPAYENGKNVTLHQLLAQRSGIRDITNIDQSGAYPGNETPDFTLSDSREENRRAALEWLFTQKLQFTPGEKFYYSNSNYFLLANIVEQVSGVSYAAFVRDFIFTPLGMTASGMYEALRDAPDLAENRLESMPLAYTVLLMGAGDVVSDASDMDKWMTALNDGTLLSKESLQAMTTDYSPKQYNSTCGYGYGICVDTNGSLWHTGDVFSYETNLTLLPGDHLHLFFVTNDMESLPYITATEQLAKNMLKKVL